MKCNSIIVHCIALLSSSALAYLHERNNAFVPALARLGFLLHSLRQTGKASLHNSGNSQLVLTYLLLSAHKQRFYSTYQIKFSPVWGLSIVILLRKCFYNFCKISSQQALSVHCNRAVIWKINSKFSCRTISFTP